MNWSQWIALVREYGPLIGLFLGMVLLQAWWINRLLDRNAAIYDAEINRMAAHMDRLLTHILGQQPSSSVAPTVRQLKDGAKELARTGVGVEKG